MGTDALTYSLFTRNVADLLLSANNLSELTGSASTARTNLGLGTLATQSGTFSGTSSGTNTGDQTITLTGGVTGTGTGSFAATVVTNANLTGHVTSVGNAAVLGSFTSAQLATALTDETGSGANVHATSPTLVTPVLGVASVTSVHKMAITAPATSSTLAVADGKTATISNTLTFTGTDASSVAFGAGGTVAYINLPQSIKSAAYTTVLADAGTEIYHPSTDNNARTFTIDSNANVAYPIGTLITFTNAAATSSSIAITTDTMTLAGSTTTGTRTLAQNGTATAAKKTSTTWIISGVGLT